jgi:cell division protein FtsX
MYYLITQLWLFLLIAFAIGIATGWFTTGRSSDDRS